MLQWVRLTLDFSVLFSWARSCFEAGLFLYLPALGPLWCEEGKASWLPAECRSTRCVFNQEQGWESLLRLDVELIVSLTPSVESGGRQRARGGGKNGERAT